MKMPALVLASLALPAQLLATDAPRGRLLAIGGGERPASVMAEFVSLAGGAQGYVMRLGSDSR